MGTPVGTPGGAPPPDEAPQTYEAALAELEALVSRMEGGSLSLEDSLAAYRRGSTLVAFCQQQLEKAEQQVRVLDGEVLRPLPGATVAARADDGGEGGEND